MTVEKFCLNCLHEIIYDTTEHHYCCECFAVRTIPDDEDMPSLEHVPAHWIETDSIPKMMAEIKRLQAENEQLKKKRLDLGESYSQAMEWNHQLVITSKELRAETDRLKAELDGLHTLNESLAVQLRNAQRAQREANSRYYGVEK